MSDALSAGKLLDHPHPSIRKLARALIERDAEIARQVRHGDTRQGLALTKSELLDALEANQKRAEAAEALLREVNEEAVRDAFEPDVSWAIIASKRRQQLQRIAQLSQPNYPSPRSPAMDDAARKAEPFKPPFRVETLDKIGKWSVRDAVDVDTYVMGFKTHLEAQWLCDRLNATPPERENGGAMRNEKRVSNTGPLTTGSMSLCTTKAPTSIRKLAAHGLAGRREPPNAAPRLRRPTLPL